METNKMVPNPQRLGAVTDEAVTKFKKNLIEFIETLNTKPAKEEIKKHPFLKTKAGPIEYIPIEVIERKLNHYFLGMWQTVNFKYEVIVNELVGDLELMVYNWEAGIWLTRSGAGAVVIQQKVQYDVDEQGRKTKKEQDLLDINRKIANTLVKDMGHLKAECIKNATKSLGDTFGSNLNRDIEDYQAGMIITPEQAEEDMETIETQKELTFYYNNLPGYLKSDKRIKNILKEREIQIKQNVSSPDS